MSNTSIVGLIVQAATELVRALADHFVNWLIGEIEGVIRDALPLGFVSTPTPSLLTSALHSPTLGLLAAAGTVAVAGAHVVKVIPALPKDKNFFPATVEEYFGNKKTIDYCLRAYNLELLLLTEAELEAYNALEA